MTWRHVSPEELARLEAMEEGRPTVRHDGTVEFNKDGRIRTMSKEDARNILDYIEVKSKYHNQKTDGFDSKKEAKRAEELRMLEKYGRITMLTYQVPYELQPGFRDKEGVYHRPIKYIADFVYIQDGKEIVCDVKSPITQKNPVYRLKKKLLLFKYPDINFSDEL